MTGAEYDVDLLWDSEAAVWVASSENIPGLAMESGSYDALIERVRFVVPELLELNGMPKEDIALRFHSERLEKVSL